MFKIICKRFSKRKKQIDLINSLSNDLLVFSSQVRDLSAMENIANLLSVYAWYKDCDGRYRYASTKWKKIFFGLQCNDNIIGKNENELITQYIQRTGNEHTFLNVCSQCDQFTIKKKKACHFLAIGYINKRLLVLEIIKKSLFDNDNKILGVVSIARDRSKEIDLIKSLLFHYIKNHIATKLEISKGQDASIYHIDFKLFKKIEQKIFPRD